jgi:amidase
MPSPASPASAVSAPSPTDLTAQSATTLARRIREREVSAVEVLEAHLGRIADWNPAVNALITIDAEGARRRAEAADRALERGTVWGPLHGVPFTAKDQFATAGMRTTYGSPRYRHHVPTTDAPLVARMRRAGAVLMGKSNLPLAAYDWQCKHPTDGRANNPWDLDRTPGGSSGGSAAALAAGLSPMELGADVGGSIRLPAHFCGVYGLRPTEGALPTEGITPADVPRTVRHIVVTGPMARSVEDLQLAWRVLSTPTSAPASLPVNREAEAGTVDVSDLHIAVTPELGGVPADRATQAVLDNLATSLAGAGATVERVGPPVDGERALNVWGRIQGFELTAGLPKLLRTTPLKDLIWQVAVRFGYGYLAGYLHRGARLDEAGYFAALDEREALARSLDHFLTDVDLWITPAAARPAFRHCRTGADLDIDGAPVPYALPIAPYNCATAVTGHPILSMPAGRSPGGLPINVQVHARRDADAALLAAAHALEV